MDIICNGISSTNVDNIQNVLKKLEVCIPDGIIEFFLLNNGGTPNKNIFSINDAEYEIRYFLSFNDTDHNYIFKPAASFLTETKKKIFPVAKDSADNYYCINLETGKIYFWDKYDNLYYCIFGCFEEFVKELL